MISSNNIQIIKMEANNVMSQKRESWTVLLVLVLKLILFFNLKSNTPHNMEKYKK